MTALIVLIACALLGALREVIRGRRARRRGQRAANAIVADEVLRDHVRAAIAEERQQDRHSVLIQRSGNVVPLPRRRS